MSQPLGSVCCNNTVTTVTIVDKYGEPLENQPNYFQCDDCGSISKYCKE